MKGLVIALQFLTRLPAPPIAVTPQEFARSMRWFPAVGLIIGLVVAGGGWLASHVDPWTGAIAALVLWVMVTGALHLDGLGDIADAAGAAHKSPERMRAVLADPHVGSFGVTAIGLQLLAKVVLLRAALEFELTAALACIPFAARIGPLVWSRWLAPLHAGLGARFRGAVRPVDLSLSIGLLLAASWLAPFLLVVLVFIPLWGWWIRKRIGGISGDGHGAGIELAETLLLFGLVLGEALT